MRKNLFVPNKMSYARGKNRPDVDCILCSIVRNDENVVNLNVYETPLFVVSLNLYPYTPGHLMVFPKRHIVDIREYTDEEITALFTLEKLCLNVLDELYTPHGYNLGYNVGAVAGASIEHLHFHIVPRYRRELGFIDIIGGAKVIVEEPNETRKRVREAFLKRSL